MVIEVLLCVGDSCKFKQSLYTGTCKDAASSETAALWHAYNLGAHKDTTADPLKYFFQA